jgi:hypothetical protein
LRSDSGFRYGLCYGPSNNCRFARFLLARLCFCPTAKLHRYHCSLVQLFKNTKVRWVSQITPVQCAFGRRCVFNDLCESTKSVSGVQGRALLKRGIWCGKGGLRFGFVWGKRKPQVPVRLRSGQALGFAPTARRGRRGRLSTPLRSGRGAASMEGWLVAESSQAGAYQDGLGRQLRAGKAHCRSLPFATPDFLSSLVALANFVRLSLRKAAYVTSCGTAM